LKNELKAIYPSLKDKIVFVTGGGGGIGASIVEAFCEQGSKVFFVDIDVSESQKLVKSIGNRGLIKPYFYECDLRNINKLEDIIKLIIKKNGTINCLVNNAAHDERHNIDDVTDEYFDDRIAVNLKHQFFTIKSIYKSMEKSGGGTIVNMGSVSWMIGQGGMPIYLSCKSAIVGLTRSMARDLGPKNIRVNSVLPGWIMTERQKKLWLTPEGEQELLKQQCLKRKLLPHEIAKVVLFFSSDDSGICTNQNFVADGGWV
tara:strand:- start:1889 stop:2662 length:774 start_codon:yes stop_codon:yes gene_type:complete